LKTNDHLTGSKLGVSDIFFIFVSDEVDTQLNPPSNALLQIHCCCRNQQIAAQIHLWISESLPTAFLSVVQNTSSENVECALTTENSNNSVEDHDI